MSESNNSTSQILVAFGCVCLIFYLLLGYLCLQICFMRWKRGALIPYDLLLFACCCCSLFDIFLLCCFQSLIL